jgi:alginate O-acetyltransferase complex protein AlgI
MEFWTRQASPVRRPRPAMIFNELSYFVLFLLPAVAGFHLASERSRPWVLSFFGVSFFVYFGYIHFGGLWGALAVLIFAWEIMTSRLYRPGSRWCLFGIGQALFFLFIFKYLTFATTTWNDLAFALHLPGLGTVNRWLLPLGVSFFTFEFVHFAADSYQGKIQRPNISEYAAFILFFPTMVAGPIKRFQDFGPKLRAARFDPALAAQGVTRILAGLAKKHALADTFALWAHKLNGPELYTAHGYQIAGWILAFGMQIYFDFSGYSDIAIGSGYLFGIVIPENFDWPYISRNISEFWRRWHISLSTWIRDYVYIPLGGSRKGEGRAVANLLIAFTASGIWHGAAYNFVTWGLWHGVLLVLHRLWRQRLPRLADRVPAFVAILYTFVTVNLGWAFFCMDMRRALVAFSRMLRLA